MGLIYLYLFHLYRDPEQMIAKQYLKSLFKNTVEPGYNDIGLYDTSYMASSYSVIHINSLLLTVTLYSPVITTQIPS